MAIQVLDVLPVTTVPISSAQVLQLDVRSTVAFVRVLICFELVGFAFREVAYDGDPPVDGATGFLPAYSAQSTIEPIVDAGWIRYHFRLLRSPAWPDSPTVRVIAFNTLGEEV